MAEKRVFSMYHKFFIAFMVGGILPMIVIASVVLNRVFKEYRDALLEGYSQSMEYAVSLIEAKMDDYDELSKVTFYYNSADQTSPVFSFEDPFSITNILKDKPVDLEGEALEIYEKNQLKIKKGEMNKFLRYASLIDQNVQGTYFLDKNDNLYGYFPNSFLGLDMDSSEILPVEDIDTSLKTMLVYPTRVNDYFHGQDSLVLTMSRNYFDVSGAVGKSKYVGTLFFDVDLSSISSVFEDMKVYDEGTISLINENGVCLFSNETERIGNIIGGEVSDNYQDNGAMIMINRQLSNDWLIKFELPYYQVFVQLQGLQRLMYIIIGISFVALILSSTLFTNRLILPIRKIMNQMSLVESGQFNIELPVTSNDELGVLSRRFNQMSRELNDYINKVYVSNLKQKEAELTSLRSQIYPHFLYNTLEVIRMTALDNKDHVVSNMIEALSDQIHYIIGKVDDFVPIQDEVNIIRKYVFLLNCRIKGELKLSVNYSESEKLMIPKLILQPIIENAYVHGIKPKHGSGTISLSVDHNEDRLEIIVMDNGIGMTSEELESLKDLLNSDEMGIRNEVSWQSIGLKNVYDRLKHLFGEEYGLEFTSTKGRGTLVKIKLPIIPMEGSEPSDSIDNS